MPDTFTLTIIFIILATVVTAFLKGRSRDKCLLDFSGDKVSLEQIGGKIIWGRLVVEATGLELIYPSAHNDKDGHNETSYIFYRNEYPTIQAVIRYHDDLSPKSKKVRARKLKRIYHPTFSWRLQRKVINFFKTVRDSFIELVNVLIAQARRASPAQAMLGSQDKYVSQMKAQAFGAMTTAFDPILEKHIGAKVILELNKNGKKFEFCGILKDYSAEYIAVMDVDYRIGEDPPMVKADIVVPRHLGLIRHLGE